MVRRKTYDKGPEPGNQPGPDAPGPRLARKFDPDTCPSGYDPDVWGLALFWVQCRDKYKHVGPGPVIVYSHLEKVVHEFALRQMALRNETDDDIPWVRLVKLMIEYFWDYDMNPSQPAGALNDFVAAGEFGDLRDMVLARAHHRRAVKRMDEARARGEVSPARQAYLDRKATMSSVKRDFQAPEPGCCFFPSPEQEAAAEKTRVRLRAGEKLGDIIREQRETRAAGGTE
jgi:hypothetical protein